MSIHVDNYIPTATKLPERIAVVGDFPSSDDEKVQVPFAGTAGSILGQAFAAAGVLRTDCMLANLQRIRSTTKVFAAPDYELKVLSRELNDYKPNIVVLMGQSALNAAGITNSIDVFRGTLFTCKLVDSPFYNRKCIASYHPRDVVKIYKYLPLLKADIARAKKEALDPILTLPARAYDLHLTAFEICSKLDNWPKHLPAAIDIEGEIPNITCMSVASSPSYAFIIDWKNMSDVDKPKVYTSVRRFLMDPEIPKIAHNALYELMCIAWCHKTPIAELSWDTMLSSWELFPELEKGLGTQTSLWTREPYYKYQRKIADDYTHNKYCCTDSLVTYEIYEKQKAALEARPEALAHFKFNQELIPALIYMQLRGMRYDTKGAQQIRNVISVELDEFKTMIDLFAGEAVNPASTTQMQRLLYTKLRLEKQYKKEKGRKTNKLTTDAEALLTLLRLHNNDCVYNLLRWKALEEVRKKIDIKIDPDGRIRTTYNIVGTDTGRLATYTSNTGSGYALNTVPKRLRPTFLADERCYMAQVDLSGADGWTVAAHCLALGDATMMEDYLAGVKPAKVICAMHITQDLSIGSLPSLQLLDIINNIKIPVWLYAAAKAVQHGSNYGMKGPTMSTNILKRSWKDSGDPIYVAPKDCLALQDLYFKRYIGVNRWQKWVEDQIARKGYLECSSGHVRTFFGRRNDHNTYMSALAHEPQANTTYVTNLALHRIANDPENRRANGTKFIIEPIHHMHDALLLQFEQALLPTAKPKIRHYFHNPITIAGQEILIPYEGEIGTYWGDSSIDTI